jgi:hypothetical protein
MGAQVLPPGKFVLGVSALGFDKSNGTEAPGVSEHEEFREVMLEGLYGLNEQAMVGIAIPYEFKRIQVDGESAEHAQGWGDISAGITYQIKPRERDFGIVALHADAKFPTGQNNARNEGGDLKEEHLQLGSGSTDFVIGVSITRDLGSGRLGFVDLRHRFNGENSRHFRYGDATFYSVGYSAPLAGATSYVIELNGRISKKDRNEDGSLDPESGGHLAYLSLSLRQNLGQNYGLVMGYQLPIISQLNGHQHEGGIVSISVSRLF